MTYFNYVNIIFPAAVSAVGLITIGLILARLYKRASKEISFVRTGFGGQKVIMNGGALVFPVLHEFIPVNMNTLRLEVHRDNEQALITRDRMRVNVVAEFYVRVQPAKESIGNAAQTLGRRTMRTDELKELVEGKFVDALRCVAAEMTMKELHEKRIDFVQKVQQAVTEDLLKNGLELETVSLTGLDQTAMEFFNPNNAFDAEGLTKLTEEIEARKKIRNDIVQETEVEIQSKNLDAQKRTLELSREEEYAKLAQEREVEIRRAEQTAEIAKKRANKEQEAEQAAILAKQQIEQSRIVSEKLVAEEQINKERVIEAQRIEKLQLIELTEQAKAIAVAEKSRDESVAKASADEARAKAVQAQEQVATVRETEIANREKAIELIDAAKAAEREAIAIKVAAQAELAASEDRAEAVRVEAKAKADADMVKAKASEVYYAVEAAGQQALNEAANTLNEAQVALKVKLKLIENLSDIIQQTVKPMENIDGIKIVQVGGLNGESGSASTNQSGQAGSGNLAEQVVGSALRYRAQAPLIDSLMQEIGIDGVQANKLDSLLSELKGDAPIKAQDTPTPPTTHEAAPQVNEVAESIE